MIIYFGDLFHTWTKGGVWTIPLNIGYVASYVKHQMKIEKNLDVEVKLFKDADKLLDAIDKKPPDVVALGFYVWNEKLNTYAFDYVKKNYPKILTVGGGPRFTNINANLEGAKIFFNDVKNCDLFVVNQGEKGFFNAIKKYEELNKSIEDLTSDVIPGSLVNNRIKNNIKIKNCDKHDHLVGENIGALDDLNSIPSPYLTGLLDEFFEDRWMPVLETNRSCPYRCTFCAWGIGTTKLLKFDEERVLKEIDYISERCKKTTTILVADANFGILERDAIFAKRMYENHLKHKFPMNVAVQWNKTRPDRILKAAKEFHDIAPVGASMQSLNEEVLSAVKRKNLTFEQILKMNDSLKELGIAENKWTELIIGLPNETKESHLMANKKLIDVGFEIKGYFLHLLPGTEMDAKDYRDKYFKKTFYRLFDNSYGIYRGEKVIECEETVGVTNSMSHNDLKFFRFFHFLLQMMWGKKWYHYFLIFLQNKYSIHPVDFINEVVSQFEFEKGKIREVYDDFMQDYVGAECFETEKELIDFWSKEKNFQRLEKGDYGKLNMLYTFKIILGYRNEFSEYILKIAERFKDQVKVEKSLFLNQCREVLKFQNCKVLNFDKNMSYKNEIFEDFNFNFTKWIDGEFKNLEIHKKPKTYRFFLPDDRVEILDIQFQNNKGSNLNSKLRDMTVYSSGDQFKYEVEII